MCQRIEKLVRGKGDKEKRKEKNPKEIECSQQSLSGCRPRILENISNLLSLLQFLEQVAADFF